MRKVRVSEIPLCSFCTEPAHVDAPTKQGPWAFMCPEHEAEHGKSVEAMGSEFVSGIHPKVDGPDVVGILEMEKSMKDDNLTVICSNCKEEKRLETDASGTYDCAGCGRSVTIPSLFDC
jgi:ribosomal protein S27E